MNDSFIENGLKMKTYAIYLGFLAFSFGILTNVTDGQDKKPPQMSWDDALGDAALLKELEIVEEQVQKLRLMYRQNRSEMMLQIQKKSQFQQDRPDQLSNQELLKYAKKLTDEANAKLRDNTKQILLPHQISRLDQLVIWSRINKSSGFADAITNSALRQLLEIDSTQAKRISSEAKKLQDEFEKELGSLRKKFRTKLNQTLTDEQQKKVKDVLGDDSSIRTPIYRF